MLLALSGPLLRDAQSGIQGSNMLLALSCPLLRGTQSGIEGSNMLLALSGELREFLTEVLGGSFRLSHQ